MQKPPEIFVLGAAFISIFLIITPPTHAANFVEIKMELNSSWEFQTKTNHHSITATCIVGTNAWYISGDFFSNAEVKYWFVGSNVIEQRTITSSMYLDRAKDMFDTKIADRSVRFDSALTPLRVKES